MVENSLAAKVGAPSAMSQTTPRIQQNKEVIFRANPQRLSMDGTPGTIKLKRKRYDLCFFQLLILFSVDESR